MKLPLEETAHYNKLWAGKFVFATPTDKVYANNSHEWFVLKTTVGYRIASAATLAEYGWTKAEGTALTLKEVQTTVENLINRRETLKASNPWL